MVPRNHGRKLMNSNNVVVRMLPPERRLSDCRVWTRSPIRIGTNNAVRRTPRFRRTDTSPVLMRKPSQHPFKRLSDQSFPPLLSLRFPVFLPSESVPGG